MKALFYLFFIFFAVLIASLLVTWGVDKLSKLIAWREFSKRPKGFRNSLSLRYWFNLATVLVLVFGFFLSWIWTENLSFGALSLLFSPWVFRGLVGYREYRAKRVLEVSALSFFSGLLGLIQSGRGLSSALFELAQSQVNPFSQKLGRHLRTYEEGRGLSRILLEFKKKIGLPVIGTYLASLEMAYRQGLEMGPLIEKMIPSIELEQGFKGKIEDLRKQMFTQATMAFMMPWFLSAVLWKFNPNLFGTLANRSLIQMIGICAFSIELIGLWVLWQLTKFS